MAGKSPFGDLLVMLPLFYVMNQIDWKNEEYVMYCRVGFGISAVLCLLSCFYLYTLVIGRNDKRKVRITEGGSMGQPSTTKEMTTVAYDVSHVKKTIINMVVGISIVCGIHFKWEMIQPLFLQIFMLPQQVYKNPLFKIYVLGNTDPELNTRPFKEESPFGNLMPQAPEPPAQTNDDENENEDNNTDSNGSKKKATKKIEPGKSPRVEELEDDDTLSEEEEEQEDTKKSKNKKKNNNKKKN